MTCVRRPGCLALVAEPDLAFAVGALVAAEMFRRAFAEGGREWG
ncbi:hypothetical protein [Streptomyces durbertensis]|nr:hypothetical protein [Streptomyces durbertensis]